MKRGFGNLNVSPLTVGSGGLLPWRTPLYGSTPAMPPLSGSGRPFSMTWTQGRFP